MLLYTAEGMAEDVEAELGQVRETLKAMGAKVREVEMPAIDVWASIFTLGTVVRVGVSPKDLPLYMQEHKSLYHEMYVADMSSGCLYAVKETGTEVEIREWVAALRRPALALQGYAVVMHLAEGVQDVDLWGYRPQALDVMKRLKRRWDPADILHGEENSLDTVL